MDLAIQITDTGLTYAQSPLSGQGEDVVGMFVRWPRYNRARFRTPADGQEQVLAQKLILQILRTAAVERVLLAIEDGADPGRVEATRAAIRKEECVLVDLLPHAAGAIGLMRAWVGQVVDVETQVQPLERTRHRKAR